MPDGIPKTSGKSHNKSSKTYLTAGRDQASTSTVLPFTGTSSIINYFKRPAEKSANIDITEEPLTSVPRVEIEDEEDENTNDNIAPIFQRDKMKTTIEFTKELISEKNAPGGCMKSTSFIYFKRETKYPWAYFNHSKNGWFCKSCEEYSNTGDAHWKNLPRKHDEHSSQFFDLENSSKHLNSIKNKKERLNVISKHTIVDQMVAGTETQSRDRNRCLIGKCIKTT